MKKIKDFDNAENQIKTYFKKLRNKSFTAWSIGMHFAENKALWEIPKSKTTSQFEEFLLAKKIVEKREFRNQFGEAKKIFALPGIDNLTLYSGLRTNSYYTHYTAMFLHELTEQIPKTYYLNFEHYSAQIHSGLTQEAIDRAFSKPQRKSTQYLTYQGDRIILLNGKYTNHLGVIKKMNQESSFEYTDLERTLIDIAIRPVYSGGVIEVLRAYENSKDLIDPKKLKHYLGKLNYTYPYKQVIGFYMDRAGYHQKSIDLFQSQFKFEFYLTYDIRNRSFDQKWKLYYPTGI